MVEKESDKFKEIFLRSFRIPEKENEEEEDEEKRFEKSESLWRPSADKIKTIEGIESEIELCNFGLDVLHLKLMNDSIDYMADLRATVRYLRYLREKKFKEIEEK